MIAKSDNLLGIGLYTASEAAMYARVSTQLMNRWVFGNEQGRSVIANQLSQVDSRFVTFLDFVQTLAVRAVRFSHGVPLTKIREAYETARRKFNVDYPFATQHKIFLFGDLEHPSKCELVIEIGTQSGEEAYEQISGKHIGQRMISEVLEMHIKDLTFDARKVASKYAPYQYNGVRVVMDPEVRFGEPYVESCGFTAQTLFESYKAEGSVSAAARAYGVSETEVVAACGYYDYLLGPKAA